MSYLDRDHLLAVMERIKSLSADIVANSRTRGNLLSLRGALHAINVITVEETRRCEGKVYWRMAQTVADEPGALRELKCNSPRRPGTDLCEFHHGLKTHFDQKEGSH